MSILLNHLRSNVVGYLALVVATGGTSYAVAELPRDSVGTAQLQREAVTTNKLDDEAVGVLKIKPGVVPRTTAKVTSVDFAGQLGDPVAAPDYPDRYQPLEFTMPASGHAAITGIVSALTQDCTSGSGNAGLYVDGLPVPGTRVVVASLSFTDGHGTAGEVFAGTVALGKGPHTANLGMDCPSGDISSSATGDMAWSVTVSR
ncbi:hypothetical protein F0U44_00300 [Nocardioides humilatus]|uniref:Uncharacterized protein n=1 Tax=Nocardioides humilatus TaxID=2607660 RepID=A0A5B1LLZ6_9ACTN|nr:hypothetical protein [Nocardioides humilatus]KAA1420830.1 hypothetical protein F0U44_00300 [Nocardioides humilatus]